MFDVSNSLQSCLNLSTNLVHCVLESSRTICVDNECKFPLRRSFKPRKGRKGSICVIYDNKRGPLIGIHYLKHCTNDKCRSIYSHGYYVDSNNDTHHESVSTLNYYHLHAATFYGFGVLEEFRHWRFRHGQSPEAFCVAYISRFAPEFSKLKNILGDETIGKRHHSSELFLQPNRLIDAFHFFEMQLYCNDANIPFIVTNSCKETAKTRKQNKVLVPPRVHTNTSIVEHADNDQNISNEQYESKQQTESVTKTRQVTDNDIIKVLFQTYEPTFLTVEPLCIVEVPCKDGQVMHGSFGVYGDGNVKLSTQRCLFPSILFNANTTNASNLDSFNCNLFVCSNSPQKGNKNAIGFLSCEDHTTALVNLGLDPYKINDYLLYCNLMIQLSKLNKKMDDSNADTKKREAIQTQLNKYCDNDKKLFDTFTSKYKYEPKRKSQRITNETVEKLYESVKKDNQSYA